MFLSHSLLVCILTALPALTVASPVVAAQPSSAPISSAICVDASQNPTWSSPGNSTLGPYGCAYALLGFKLYLRKNLKSSFDFFSKDKWSHITPKGAWGLPDGASSRTGSSCVAMIRMARDFGPTALPYQDGTSYFPTRNAPSIQRATMRDVVSSLELLLKECSDSQKGGWIATGTGIVAALWPIGSKIDDHYGFDRRTRRLGTNGTVGPI